MSTGSRSKCMSFRTMPHRTEPQLSFMRLHNAEKLTTLNSRGQLVGARAKTGFVIFLYKLDSFFVELWRSYDTRSRDVKVILTFSSQTGLNTYKHLSN